MTRAALSILSLLILTACPGGGVGNIAVTANGEEAAVEGFESLAFGDAWEIAFDHVLVSIHQVALQHEDGSATSLSAESVVDLHTENGATIASGEVAAGRLALGFEVAPPEEDAEGLGASAEDVTAMHDSGFGVWIAGSAEKAGQIVTFDVGYPIEIDATDCTNGTDDTEGVVVEDSAETPAEITMHLEHIFYDKLGGHDGVQLIFQPWADAAGGDGHVDTDDLENADLANFPAYDPESEDVDNVHDFGVIAVAEMFHLNGEGLCTLNGEVHDHEDHDDHEE